MWLSSIPMEHQLFAGRQCWHDAHWQHQRVMRAFPQVEGRPRSELGVLFRVEPAAGLGRVLVQSLAKPEQCRGLRTIALDSVLDRMSPGADVRLRIAVNAVRTVNVTEDGKTRQCRVPVSLEATEDWVRGKLERCGITQVSDLTCDIQVAHFKSTPLHIVLVDAAAVVADAKALRCSVADGVGRAKAYGCGLLSLMPMRVPHE